MNKINSKITEHDGIEKNILPVSQSEVNLKKYNFTVFL